jgi:hypothetical protein
MSTFLFISCNDKSDGNLLVLKSLFMPSTSNIISLKKDTISNEYFLKDNYNLFTLSSYFSKENIKQNGGELQLLKDTYSNNSTGKGFVIKYLTNDYLSYTFLEYQNKKLEVKYLVEILNVDNKIVNISKMPSDTISKLISRKIDIDAKVFFSDSFIFNNNRNLNYNYLVRKNEWILQPKSRQEKWSSTHFLYKDE